MDLTKKFTVRFTKNDRVILKFMMYDFMNRAMIKDNVDGDYITIPDTYSARIQKMVNDTELDVKNNNEWVNIPLGSIDVLSILENIDNCADIQETSIDEPVVVEEMVTETVVEEPIAEEVEEAVEESISEEEVETPIVDEDVEEVVEETVQEDKVEPVVIAEEPKKVFVNPQTVSAPTTKGYVQRNNYQNPKK